MKLLFVHGGEKVKIDNENNCYTDGSYNEQVWKKYEYISNDITVIFRKDKNIYEASYAKKVFQSFDKNKYKLVFIKNVYESIYNFISIKIRAYNNELIKNEVKEADIIIARVPSNESYIAIKYAKKYNKKCLVEVVGCPFDALWHHSIKGKMLAPFEYLKMKKVIKHSSNVIYVTDKFLQKRYHTNGNQIGCSDVIIDERGYKVLEDRLIKIKENSNKKIIIGTIGNVNLSYKGQADVIKAIEILQNEGYNIEYQLVGGGNNEKLRKLSMNLKLKDNIIFLGPMQHEKIFGWLEGLDIYIQPSITEGLCRSLIEAMSMACPCIASNAGGNVELIDEEFIFKKKNIRDLANKIKEILKENNFESQAKINFEKSKNYYEKNLDAKKYKFYDLLLK